MIKVDFEKGNGLVPCIVQDVHTHQVLMLGYMNKESLEETLRSGLATYWSRSRNELWKKGETSGHYQHVKNILIDCDEDTLLIEVEQDGAACHTGKYSCFYRTLEGEEIL
jgi:phosphoribosyl-AMP cyclohydrolase